MAAPRKYPHELRERATRMAVELRQDPGDQAWRDRSCGRAARHACGDPAGLGPAGRDRRRDQAGHHVRGRRADRQSRAGEPRAKAREPHLEDLGGFLRGGARPPHHQVVAYIDAHRHDVVDGREVGVEPICAVLKKAGVQVAPSGYYASKTRERPRHARSATPNWLRTSRSPTGPTWVSMAPGRSTPSSTAKASGSPSAPSNG